MPTVTDEYGRKREISMEEFLRVLANADSGDIMLQEVTTDIYTGRQTVRNIPVASDGSFDFYGTGMHFNAPSYSTCTPSKESKEERKCREKAMEEQYRKKADKIREIRNRLPEELRNLRRNAEDRLGYTEAKRIHELLESEYTGLEKEKERISSELETLNIFLQGKEEQWQHRKDTVRENRWALMEERSALLEEKKKLGLFYFVDGKRIQNRIKEINKIIKNAKAEDKVRERDIDKLMTEHLKKLEYSRCELVCLKRSVEGSLEWRKKAIQVYMEENPEEWELYEKYLLPVLEYMDRHGWASYQEIYENHPCKDEMSREQLVKYMHNKHFMQFYQQKREKGMTYSSLFIE